MILRNVTAGRFKAASCSADAKIVFYSTDRNTRVIYSANKQHADPKTLLILSWFNEVNKTPQTKWDGAQTDGNNPSFLHASQR